MNEEQAAEEEEETDIEAEAEEDCAVAKLIQLAC